MEVWRGVVTCFLMQHEGADQTEDGGVASV